MPYPPDLGIPEGRLVVDNGAPPLDGDRYTLAEAVQPPAAPTLGAIYPATFTIGGPDVLLHAIGGPFHADDRIVIAATVERTSFVSSTELTTWIESALWTSADPAVPVKVRTQSGDTAIKTFAVAA
jgi:hypothetical protein